VAEGDGGEGAGRVAVGGEEEGAQGGGEGVGGGGARVVVEQETGERVPEGAAGAGGLGETGEPGVGGLGVAGGRGEAVGGGGGGWWSSPSRWGERSTRVTRWPSSARRVAAHRPA